MTAVSDTENLTCKILAVFLHTTHRGAVEFNFGQSVDVYEISLAKGSLFVVFSFWCILALLLDRSEQLAIKCVCVCTLLRGKGILDRVNGRMS